MIANYFHVSVDYLIGRTENRHSNSLPVSNLVPLKHIIKSPKTAAGYRFCPLPPDVVKEARAWKYFDLSPDVIRYRWANMKDKYGFQWKFHAFRHYWASLLHSQGVPDQYIIKIGGWESTDMLHSIYAHALCDKLPEYTDKVVDIFKTEFSADKPKKKA